MANKYKFVDALESKNSRIKNISDSEFFLAYLKNEIHWNRASFLSQYLDTKNLISNKKIYRLFDISANHNQWMAMAIRLLQLMNFGEWPWPFAEW